MYRRRKFFSKGDSYNVTEGEVMGTRLGAAYRSKLRCGEGSDMFSSNGSFYSANDGNLEGLLSGEGYLLGISEVT